MATGRECEMPSTVSMHLCISLYMHALDSHNMGVCLYIIVNELC